MTVDSREKLVPVPVLAAVDRCIQTCAARSEAYTRAAEEVSDGALKELLGRLATERGSQAVALRAAVGPFRREEAPSRIRMRRWHEPRARSDRSVLDDCLEGNRRFLAALDVAFLWAPLSAIPREVRELLLSTYGATLRTRRELRVFGEV